MARGVGNDPGKRGGCCRQLGGYPAGPEYGYFTGPNGNGITEVRLVKIADISFIEDEEVISKILKHLGLWEVKQRPPPRANALP